MITDPLGNEDWSNWQKLSTLISKDIYLTADDLLGANRARLDRIIKEKISSSIMIHPNQAGTLTETLSLIDMARKNQLSVLLASDLEETDDHFIADLSVGTMVDFINFGPPVHG